MTPEETAVLLNRAAAGDPAAWEAIVAEHGVLLRSVVRRFRLGEAQSADAVQLTWLRLVQNIDRIRDPARLAGWLQVTAHRICISMIRQSARETPTELSRDAVPLRAGRLHEVRSNVPEESLLRQERTAVVRRAVARLPEKQRQLLTLLVASPPLSYEEIAGRLGIPIGSIGPTRGRILDRLRSNLRADDFQDCAVD